jgi:hypothetical protein
MEHIKEISTWDMPDTKTVKSGWDNLEVPDLTAKNIEFLMNKINEVIQAVNQLLPPQSAIPAHNAELTGHIT